jgi:hypothetical protein
MPLPWRKIPLHARASAAVTAPLNSPRPNFPPQHVPPSGTAMRTAGSGASTITLLLAPSASPASSRIRAPSAGFPFDVNRMRRDFGAGFPVVANSLVVELIPCSVAQGIFGESSGKLLDSRLFSRRFFAENGGIGENSLLFPCNRGLDCALRLRHD